MAGVILNFRPFGNPAFNNVAIGGDILVVAGVAVLIGVTHVIYNLFQQSVVMGGRTAVLGECFFPFISCCVFIPHQLQLCDGPRIGIVSP